MPDRFDSVTVAIVARNAEATIGRAIESALRAGAVNILLVDDASDDETLRAAKAVGAGALRIVENTAPVSVGHVRGLALEHIKTPFGLWLDADDALAENHIGTMVAALEGGADFAFAACELMDGTTGKPLKTTGIPNFMRGPGALYRAFERNWLPSLHAGFRTNVARSVGYDPAFTCVEDYDFLLRAIVAGHAITLNDEPSYHYYHYAGTISRNRAATGAHMAKALNKHDNEWLLSALERNGYAAGDAGCVLASKAMFEQDYDAALSFAISAASADDRVVAYDAPARHISAFYAGTAAALRGYFADAMNILEPLGTYMERPEVYNNVAVCFAECGDRSAASLSLEMALALNPGYLDAKLNKQALMAGERLTALTKHPLRVAASRDAYER